jgi:hypothetical protein
MRIFRILETKYFRFEVVITPLDPLTNSRQGKFLEEIEEALDEGLNLTRAKLRSLETIHSEELERCGR